jgi:hypothetical protein
MQWAILVSLFFFCQSAWDVSRSGGIQHTFTYNSPQLECTSPIVSGHSIAGVQAGEPGEPGEPGELGQAWGDLQVSPVLAAHEAIQI